MTPTAEMTPTGVRWALSMAANLPPCNRLEGSDRAGALLWFCPNVLPGREQGLR
jgi:hypothetical protein